jgi:NADH-quinone oxidoreductase subunit J
MITTFYIAAAIAIVSTVLMITRLNAVHALLYLVVSLLAVAIVFYVLGAPFVAALEVIIYAGAIMVLFIFVMMMLNLGEREIRMERSWVSPGGWVGPAILSAILLIQLGFTLSARQPAQAQGADPKQVALSLYGPYLLGVELASMLLLAGIVGAYHLGRARPEGMPVPGEKETVNAIGPYRESTLAGGDLVHAGTGRTAGPPERDIYPDVN